MRNIKTMFLSYGIKPAKVSNELGVKNSDFSLNIENASDPKYPKALVVEAFTKNLYLRSVDYCTRYPDTDTINLFGLYASPDVMGNYATGNIKTLDQAKAWIKILSSRLQNGDPYSGYMVYERATNKFLGMATIGHSDKAGEAQLAILLAKDAWNQHNATEVGLLLMFVVAQLEQNYSITNSIIILDPQTNKEVSTTSTDKLTKLTATVRKDSQTAHILQQLGFKHVGDSNIYGEGEKSRQILSIEVTDIKQMLQQTDNLSTVRNKVRARL